jgi:hypothetical protein
LRSFIFGDGGAFKYPGYEQIPADSLSDDPAEQQTDELKDASANPGTNNFLYI